MPRAGAEPEQGAGERKRRRTPGELPPAPEAIPPRRFRDALMRWYREHARVLPWRGIDDPYGTWLSEIMLQQTRVATVIDRYQEFLRQFPTIQALAEADEDAVLALWSGLGYYRRARMLHRGAQFVARELDGHLPGSSAKLRTLPGIGEYTAAAVGSIAFGESIAVVDGNVERVLLRLLGQPEEKTAAQRAEVNAAAQSLVPRAAKDRTLGNPPGDHNQAMMELGATICLPRDPLCLQCPVLALCRTRGEHRTQPRGQLRSRTVAHLLAVRKRGRASEVLLERRAADLSLMPGMLELPPLPLAAVERREPVLRLRHGITNTNYQVEVYSDTQHEPTAPRRRQGNKPIAGDEHTRLLPEPVAESEPGNSEPGNEDEEVFEAAVDPHATSFGEPRRSLLAEVPARESDLLWLPASRLRELPLTGLARKCLQRLRLMQPDVRHGR